MNQPLPEEIRRRNRRNLVLLALLFALPLTAAYVLHYIGWKPGGASNYGDLVSPARPLEDIELLDADGGKKKLSELRTKWLLLVVGKNDCGKVCKDNLYKMRQIHTAQGKHTRRVKRVFIVPKGKEKALSAELTKIHPKLMVYGASAPDLKRIQDKMVLDKNQAVDPRDCVYLVDPIGNLMMRYLPEADATGMRKDLGRLLRLSQVG